MGNEKNLHEGHRQRLKDRFNESGLDNFQPHNILELLLFYSIPRRDTNDIAHELIEKFGSLSGVFDADAEDLVKVNYITENSATLIKLIPSISRAYLMDKAANTNNFSNVEAIKEFLLSLYHGEKNEVVYALLLNNKYDLITYHKIHDGSVNSALIDVRRVIEFIVKANASMLIIAHNHPNGTIFPSMEDIETTGRLINIFKPFNIPIVEHFIVNEFDCYPIINKTSSLQIVCTENKNLFKKGNS